MKFFLFLFLISLSILSNAQLLPKGTVGLQTGFLKGGNGDLSDLTNGLNCTFKLMDIPINGTKNRGLGLNEYKRGISIDFFYNSVGNRSFFEKGLDSDNPVLDALSASNKQLSTYGLQFPLRRFALLDSRQMGIRGVSCYPKIGAGLSTLTNAGIKSKGFSFNASLACNLPFFIVEGGLNYYSINDKSIGSRQSLFYPYVSLKADALFELLGLGTVASDTKELRHMGNYQYSRVEGEYLVTYSGNYDYTETTSYARIIIKPFWGIAPRYTFASQGYKGATKMFGAGISGRYSYFGYEGVIDVGKLGYGSNTEKSYLHDPFPEGATNQLDKTTNTFAAEGQAVLVQAKFSMNLFGLMLKAIAGMGGSDVVSSSVVSKGDDDGSNPSAFRIMTGFGLGYGFLSQPKYIYQNANELKDAEFLATPDLWNAPTNDVRLSKSTTLVSSFFSIEIGAVNVEFGRYFFNKYNASLGNGNYATISYIIPIGKIIKAYSKYHEGDEFISE